MKKFTKTEFEQFIEYLDKYDPEKLNAELSKLPAEEVQKMLDQYDAVVELLRGGHTIQ